MPAACEQCLKEAFAFQQRPGKDYSLHKDRRNPSFWSLAFLTPSTPCLIFDPRSKPIGWINKVTWLNNLPLPKLLLQMVAFSVFVFCFLSSRIIKSLWVRYRKGNCPSITSAFKSPMLQGNFPQNEKYGDRTVMWLGVWHCPQKTMKQKIRF